MPRTRIKICGITSESTALAACEAGVDAIGLMFYESSSRHIDIDQAAAICRILPPFVTAVAVMVNPEVQYVTKIIEKVKISQLQFHGEESDEYCYSFNKPYVKAIRVNEGIDLQLAEKQYPRSCGIQLETHINGIYGGSGERFDWQRAHYDGEKPLILAGGLTPENIAEAISIVKPYAVDISSGVESDGNKDVEKMRRFCANVYNS